MNQVNKMKEMSKRLWHVQIQYISTLWVSSIQGSADYPFDTSGTFGWGMQSFGIQIKITSEPNHTWAVCISERLCCLGKLNGFDNRI